MKQSQGFESLQPVPRGRNLRFDKLEKHRLAPETDKSWTH